MNEQADSLLKIRHLFRNDVLINNLIAFTSGKGGTGKSFLSLNTAFALSQKGLKVLLIDMDINYANIHILLNEIPRKSLKEFLEGRELFKNIISHYTDNLFIIYGISGEINLASGLNTLFNKIAEVSNQFDLIILDMGPGYDKKTKDLLKKCNSNYIVASPEPAAVMDAYVLMKQLKIDGYVGKNYCVVNKCTEDGEGEFTFENLKEACKRFLDTSIYYAGKISFDLSVMKASKEQNILIKQYPLTEASTDLMKVATSIMEKDQLVNIHQSC